MEVVDWEFLPEEAPAGLTSFRDNQVGSVSLPLEPVAAGSPIHWVAEQFHARPELTALPVENDGGVVGLISRARILERSTKLLDGLLARPLDQDLTPHGTLDARESVDKAVSNLFGDASHTLTDLFLVYMDGRYYGVTDLRRLVSRSAQLRDQDLNRAREFQESSLARSTLGSPDWKHSRLVRMAYGVGGDFYHEMAWPDGRCLVCCLDVSGKGLSGALVTSALRGYLAALGSEPSAPAPSEFSLRLNAFLQSILPLGTFVTGVLFFLPSRRSAGAEVSILNFGYSPVYFYTRKDSTVAGRGLKPNLPPLGLDDLVVEASDQFRLPMEPGTKAYVFSDGMVDLMNTTGSRYGEKRLKEFLSKSYKLSAADFLASLETEIQLWQDNAPLADDITALTLQF